MAGHGKWRVMACQLTAQSWFSVVLITYNGIATLLQQVRYGFVVCSRKWEIRAVFFVGMLGRNRQDMLVGNNHHPASSHNSTHWKLTYLSTPRDVSPLHTYMWNFLNIYLHQNITITFTNHYMIAGCAFVVAKKVFHQRNGNILKLWEWSNDEKQLFSSIFNYINKHSYLKKKFKHLKLKYPGPCNFLTKHALGEPTKHACGC